MCKRTLITRKREGNFLAILGYSDTSPCRPLRKSSLIEKKIDGQTFTGIRFFLELPVTMKPYHGGDDKAVQVQGPFIHHPGDDDSSAVTFWGKKDLRDLLAKAIDILDAHYGNDVSFLESAATGAKKLIGTVSTIFRRPGTTDQSDYDDAEHAIAKFLDENCVFDKRAVKSVELSEVTKSFPSIALVLEERQHQQKKYGDDHDDEHTQYELSAAASCYLSGNIAKWPWVEVPEVNKPPKISDLMKGAALACAEIDRLNRIKDRAHAEAEKKR